MSAEPSPKGFAVPYLPQIVVGQAGSDTFDHNRENTFLTQGCSFALLVNISLMNSRYAICFYCNKHCSKLLIRR